MSDLKPCPHCGEEPVEQAIEAHKHYLVNLPDYPGSHVIECVCGAGSIGETRDEAKAKWNRRAQPAPITSESGNQAAQGASAITSESMPLLTEDELQAIEDNHLEGGSLWDVYRAIEQAVRSKLGAGVPLTDDQWQRIADITESFLTRDIKDEIEAVIGIVGKEGGNV